MFLNQEEAHRRLNSSNNLVNLFSKVPYSIPPSGAQDSIDISGVEDSLNIKHLPEENNDFDPDSISDDLIAEGEDSSVEVIESIENKEEDSFQLSSDEEEIEDDDDFEEENNDDENNDDEHEDQLDLEEENHIVVEDEDDDDIEYVPGPIAVVSDEDREIIRQITRRNVDYPNLIANPTENDNYLRILLKTRGRKAGIPGLSEEDRTQVAIDVAKGILSQKEIAAKYNITQPTVSYAAKKAKKKDKRKVDEVINDLRDSALNRLCASIGLITDDKMANLDAVKLSIVSTNLARVVEKMTPKVEEKNEKNRMQVVIFAPETKKESAYRTVEISAG